MYDQKKRSYLQLSIIYRHNDFKKQIDKYCYNIVNFMKIIAKRLLSNTCVR